MNTSTCEELGTCKDSDGPNPLLVLPVLLSVLWVLFDLFYASSLVAFVVNRLANFFLKESGIYIGALRISLLSGRILLKDVHYYCRDYSVRVTDGYVVFRWWSRIKQKVCSECASCGSTEQRPPFIFFQLNGVQWHWYNRSDVYDNCGQVKPEENTDGDNDGQGGDGEESALWNMWKEMRPSLHFSLKKGRFVFGNHLVERSLALHFDTAEMHYSTVDASNPYDELMHEFKWRGMNIKLILEPSAGWEGGSKEKPPITCGGVEGTYPLIKSDSADITYSFDSPGLVPLGETRGPKYAFDVLLGQNTVINYGAYGLRQRLILQKMFFPNDYVEQPPSKCPEPGEKRIFLFFDVSFQLSSPATFNVLFRDDKNKEVVHHLAVELGAESTLTINQPWTMGEDGYTSVVTGRLVDVRVNTSLEYQPLGKAATIEFKNHLHFPRLWNATQTWDMNFTISKVQINILFTYIDFINAFLEDWVGTDASDLLSFVPLDWRITINMRDYEVFLFTNRYNWVDVAMDGIENTRVAICGTTGQLKFELPFTEFLPPIQRIIFTAAGQNIVLRQYISPSCSTRESIFALSSFNKHRWRVMEFPEEPAQTEEKKEPHSAPPSADSSPLVQSKATVSKGSVQTLDSDQDSRDILIPQQLGSKGKQHSVQATKFWVGDGASVSASVSQDEASMKPTEKSLDTVADTEPEQLPWNEFFPMGCRVETHYENGWLDMACGPSIFIGITYHSHVHDVELSSDSSMKPNVLKIEVDVPTVLLRVFGHLGRNILALKENYPGEYIDFTAFNSLVPYSPPPERSRVPKPQLVDTALFPEDATEKFKERFLDIYVDFKLRNITAEFPTHLPEGYPRDFPLPSAFSSELSVSLDYMGQETKVRLRLEPVTIHLPSAVVSPSPSGGVANEGGVTRDGNDPVYELGTLGCTGLEFNCHGFTEFLCQDRVEYAWLMQLLVGRITGAVSTEQFLQLVNWLQTAFGHAASHGDSFIAAPNAKLIEPDVDPYSEIIKYKLFDLNILEADIHLQEGSTVTRIQTPGFDLDMCTLHSDAETLGLSLQLQGLTATSYLPSSTDPACMLECGLIDVGNVQGDLNLREREECVPYRQREFLKLADGKTRRLWFLWRDDEDGVGGRDAGRKELKDEFRCGCCGGCPFLGGCIERQLPRDKMHSVAYTSQLSTEPEKLEKQESGSAFTYKSLGLQSLRKVLSAFSIKELDCIQYLHQGLLDHYAVRYGKPNITSSVYTEGNKDDQCVGKRALVTESSNVSIHSDGSFVSALSNPESSDDDRFMSLENLNETGLGMASPFLDGRKIRHRKKPSALSQELKAMASSSQGKDSIDAPFYDPLANTSYKGVVASCSYKGAVLYIPLKKRKANVDDKKKVETLHDRKQHLHRQQELSGSPILVRAAVHADTKSMSSRDTQSLASGTLARKQLSKQATVAPKEALRLRIPVLMPLSERCVPSVVQKDSDRGTKERKKRIGLDLAEETDENKLALVSLSLSVKEKLSVTLSPPFLSFIERVTWSIGSFFEQRSAPSILDVISTDSNGAVQSHISKLLADSFNTPPAPKPPLLHLAVSMPPGAFATIQLLQAPLEVPPMLRKPPPKSSTLKEIIPHTSLVSFYLSGLSCNALIKTATEVQHLEGKTETGDNTGATSAVHRDKSGNTHSSGNTKSRTLLSTVKISVKAQCPVLQASVSALVTEDRGSEGAVPLSTLPKLPSSQQSQLNYFLVIPDPQPSGRAESDERISPVKVCNLLEMGIRDASITCVSKVIQSEVSEDSILTWANVRSYRLTDPTSIPKSEDFETKNNKVVIQASLPSLWTQLASPHTGIPNSSTGGLDLLILTEAINAWKPGVEHLVNMGQLALEKKENREERVLLALLSNTARIALCKKGLNPLLSKTSASLRQSVVYNCMFQLWRSLAGYSEAQVASLPEDHSYEEEIVAATLALATRLYSQLEAGGPTQKKQQLPRVGREGASSRASSSSSRRRFRIQAETESVCSVGYLSISPSPSELAIPNIGIDNLEFIDFEQLASNVNFEKFVVVRESIIPFLNVAGIRVDPQLRTVCHNSAEFSTDFTIELREATAFIAESTPIKIQPPTPKIQPLPPGTPRRHVSLRDLPVLYIEQFIINGCLKYSSESSFQKMPTLSILVKKSPLEEGTIKRYTKSKTNVSAQCCVSLDTISGNITVPALKFARHMIEMNKFRTSGREKKKEKAAGTDVDASEEPGEVTILVVPTVQRTLPKVEKPEETIEGSVDEVDFARDDQEGEEPSSVMNVWAFSQKLLSFFTSIEEQSLPSLVATTPSSKKVTRRLSHQSSVSSVHSTKPKTIELSRSPRYPRPHRTSSSEKPQQSRPYLSVPVHFHSDSSTAGPHETTSVTSGEVAINIDDTDGFQLSPDDHASTQDTYGDTTDSPDMDPVLHRPATSSDTEPFLHSSSPNVESFMTEISSSKHSSEYGSSVGGAWFSDTDTLVKSQKLSERELLFSVFGLLKINTVKLDIQVETTSASLELMGISGAVDARKAGSTLRVGTIPVVIGGGEEGEREGERKGERNGGEGERNEEEGDKGPLLAASIPTYFSLSITLKKSLLKLSDQGLLDSEIALLSGHPIYCSVGVCNSIQQPVPAYRCLLKLLGLELDVKQSPVMVHKRFQTLVPAFTRVYNDVFALSNGELDPAGFEASTPGVPVVNMAEMKMPARLPQGLVHLSLDKVALYMAPLPSLSVTYSVAPVRAQVETSPRVNFSFELGKHFLKFNPRDPKDELAMRTISLPTATLKGDVRTSRRYKLPKVSVDLAVKQVNIDLTTDVLNQLLVVQGSFIKELNELVQLFINIGESIPRRQRLASGRQASTSGQTSETDLLSLLDSFKLALSGITITISTPLSTALRFNTGKIDMLVNNVGNLLPQDPATPSKSQLSLSRKVEIDISLALGYLQDSGPDVVDDFCELAYFRTKISIRNTHQTSRLSDPVAEDQPDFPLPADTFLISIQSPHLYIQSNAVEQAILFWLNCKSVYSYWQNERKQLNEEVQAATENFMKTIHKPSQLQAPSIDFSKCRLVKITVSDMGLCMPLIPMPSTPHSAQKSFPATVLTIKEMQLSLNLSHKVASTGNFSGFCLRFAEQFYLRHKTWTMDPKKHKFSNCSIVKTGILKLCVATENRYSEVDPSVIVGEKLIWAFQWDMSGIEIYSNTTVGRHISTLVKTVTTIGSDLEGRKTSRPSSTFLVPKSQPPKMRRAVSTPRGFHRRAQSLTVPSKNTAALEEDVALHTKKITRLRQSGAKGENLKSEEDALRLAERNLAREVGRMLRRKKVSLQRLNQIFSPRALSVESSRGVERGGSLRRQLSKGARAAADRTRRKLFSHSEHQTTIAEEPVRPVSAQDMESDTFEDLIEMRPRAESYSGEKPSHVRAKSDITDLIQYMRMEEGQGGSPTLLSPVSSPTSEGPYPSLGGISGDEGRPESSEGVSGVEEDRPFAIDVVNEVNVTINMDSGIIILRTESPEGVESSERRASIPLSSIHSPHMLTKIRHTEIDIFASKSHNPSKHPSSGVDSVLRIPALNVRFHYKSIVQNGTCPPDSVPRPKLSPEPLLPIQSTQSDTHGRSSPSRLQKSATWAPGRFTESLAESRAPATSPAPTKRGVLSLSAIIASVPENMELTPSLLEFIEQVAKPTIAATAVTSSSETNSDSTDMDSETEGAIPTPQTPGESSSLSFPVDVTIALQIQSSTVYLTCKPHSRVQCMIQSPDISFVVSFSLFSKREFDDPSTTAAVGQEFANKLVTFNNLYITGCLTTFALQLFSPQVSSMSQSGSFAPKMENKEALSLTLGQALIHLSRKSVLAPSTKGGKGIKSVDDYALHSKLQVSVNTNIASLVVGYDMRRLNDITAFRRYWYHTSLVEALFIGSKKHKDGDQLGTPPTSGEDSSSAEPSHIGDMDDSISAAIAVRARIEDFRFSSNVAQVMGNTNLLVTQLNIEVHMDISHNELVLINLDACIEKGEVDARGGVVAGSILMENTRAHLTTDSQQGNIPDHTGNASVHLIEGRVDYMSSPIILGRASEFRAEFYDSWEGLQLGEVETAEAASILILADFSWDKLQLSMHRSTTKSMFSIVQKIQEFIAQQQKRSERTISLMLPAGSAASRALAQYRKEKKEAEEKRVALKEDLRHHWLWAMKVGSMNLMRTLGIHTPEGLHNVLLGGTITIKGQNVCIVCFHGTSFRDTEWAVFNSDFINASFSTRAIPGLLAANVANKGQEGYNQFERRRTCQQICTLELGTKESRSNDLAAVYRVSAPGRVPPITGTNVNDWLAYACIDYHLHKEKYDSLAGKQSVTAMVKFSRKLSIQPVLLVPAFTMKLTNDHFWPLTTNWSGLSEGSASPDVPIVECSLVSTFSEGISVTTTVDHYLFLHDLVTGYIEYLEKHKTPMIHTQTLGPTSPSATAAPEPQSKEGKIPHRKFVSVCWELDPHLLLLSTVSGQFNPHINWLLEKLGFTHARTTIPKWIQRGAMDPLDMAIANLVELLVLLTGSKKLQKRATSPPPVSDV